MVLPLPKGEGRGEGEGALQKLSCLPGTACRPHIFRSRFSVQLSNLADMKNFWLSKVRPVAVLTFLAISALSLFAHPGHDLGAYGAKHVITSPYHLAILATAGLILCAAARFIQHRISRRCVQITGAVALVAAAVLWIA
jgi:hypothetical protein